MRTPEQTFKAMTGEIEDGLKATFPITSGSRTLEFHGLHSIEMPDASDWNGQKDATLNNRTWGVPLKGMVSIKDSEGKVIDKKVVNFGVLPTPTNRHTFIVDGREYQVSHQRRLRPGIYTKLNRLGEPVADFNLAKGRNFSVVLDPAENEFHLKFGNTHVPLQPVLKHVFATPSIGLGGHFNKDYTQDQEHAALKSLYAETHLNKPVPESMDELKSQLSRHFSSTKMDPSVNMMTIKMDHAQVSANALLDAAHRVLKIHKKELLPTTKDQMAYTEVHGVEDFLRERLEKNRHAIALKVRQKLDRANEVGDVNLQGAVHPLIHSFFTTSSLSNNPIQVNPLEMRENAFKITSMGEGGIGDSNAIPLEVRNIHPSSVGFLDPVRTPDNAKAGVDVRASLSTRKVKKQLYTEVISEKTGQKVSKSPEDLFNEYVAHDKEPVENGVVRAIYRGHVVHAKPSQIAYRIPTDNQYTVSTTLVPFIPNAHAHRVAMGAKMAGQALSLVDREVPLVDTPHSDVALDGLLPTAPVAGVVHKIDSGVVTIKGHDGATHKVNFAHKFPLNGGSFLHTDLHVKEGDAVKKGQVLGDNNFSKGSRLALGKNLDVAYIPKEGWNYEDGFVVTESGASKLTSQHLHTEEIELDERSIHGRDKFKAHFPGKYELDKLDKLDDHGVVKVGQIVREGDPLIAMMRKRVQDPEQLILGKAHKSLMEPFRDAAVEWDKPYDGKVTNVVKTGGHIKVTIESHAPAIVGDKICGRFGNKGVIAAIIPDKEAPRTKDGRIPDVMINSAGLVSRMNPSQNYEISAGKALRALGKTSEKFPHFLGADTHKVVSALVEKAGVSPDEEMFDGKTGQSLGKIMMGPQYMLKLFKQAETGFSARSGGKYDIDLRPAKGGEEGAKSVGYLDLFGLLAHGSRNILRENATYKAEYNPEVLHAMWSGAPLPPPKTTFAFNKFEAMLKGAGVNVKKDGSKMVLLPMTDKDVLKMSSGAIARPLTVNAKEDEKTGLPFRPEEGGLFDVTATGGLVGNRWSHITLHEPIVNPLFHKPARIVLGMKKDEFQNVLSNEGGTGIAKRLKDLSVSTRMDSLRADLRRTNSASKKDEIYKQLKYLGGLKRSGVDPHEAYILNHIPVVPPNVRPMYPDSETGKIVNSDANVLYQNLMLVNDQLAKHKSGGDPETVKQLRLALHDHVAKVQGIDGNLQEMASEKDPKGFLKIITGNTAKSGFFQSKLISRRQDVAGRGVVVPNPTLGIDEAGIPEPMAWKVYRNHTVGELSKAGMPLDAAAKEVEDQSAIAKKALMTAMDAHPIILTRAPSLHRFNLQAFKPRIVGGKSIEVNTLIHKGFNLDHDGDQMNVHVTLTPEAAKESFRMLPSNNLYNTLNRSPVHVPTQETIMGLWKATRKLGDKPVRKFKTKEEALAAYRRNEIRADDPIEIGG